MFFLPWYLFLFIGAFDWGYYAHALIATQNAARVAALYTSSDASHASDSAGACQYAIHELGSEINMGSATCPATALPVIVTAQQVTGADGKPATRVTVTYQTARLIPIPGVLKGQYTFVRAIEMKL